MENDLNNISVPGITIIKEIGSGSFSRVFLCKKNDSNDIKEYALKFFKTSGTKQNLHTLYREANLLARLHHENLLQVFESGLIENNFYFIMEFSTLPTLTQVLEKQNQKRFDQVSFLTFAIRCVQTLSYIHQKGLIHRDIKPENILLSENLSEMKLIDFGLASLNTNNEISKSNSFVGTPRYSSPEQCGMIDQPIDERSDLYSLGILFFQCLTGTPPFTASEIAELFRQHAYSKPPRVDSLVPGLDPRIADIVDTLLKKDPSDRYSSSHLLLNELFKIQNKNSDFKLFSSQKDQHPLFGRHDEIEKVQKLIDQVLTKEAKTLLVSGEPGSGKSRFISEIQVLAENRGFQTFSTKCSQLHRSPFESIKRILDEFLLQLSNSNESYLDDFRENIVKISGNLISKVKTFSPRLSLLLKNTVDTELPDDIHDAFIEVLTQIILSINQNNKSLLLMIDDIQWIDDSSLDFLKNLSARIKNRSIFILFSSRNDKENQQKLQEFEVRFDQDLSLTINLKSLNQNAISDIVHYFLGTLEVPNSIPHALAIRSQGSPLIAWHLLQSMLDYGIIFPNWGSWHFDESKMRSANLPQNSMDLIFDRISKLPIQTFETLKIAALIGEEGSLSMLIELTQLTKSQLSLNLTPAIDAGLFEIQKNGLFNFSHDRVRESISNQLTEEQKKEINQRIALSYEKIGVENSDRIFTLADHYNNGLIDQTPNRTYQINIQAANRATQNFAYEIANTYFKNANQIAIDHSIQHEWNFYFNHARVLEDLGDFETARFFYEKASEICPDKISIANIYIRMSISYKFLGQEYKSLDTLQLACEKLGFKIVNTNNKYRKYLILLEAFLRFSILRSIAKMKLLNLFSNSHDKEDLNRSLISVVNQWMYLLVSSDSPNLIQGLTLFFTFYHLTYNLSSTSEQSKFLSAGGAIYSFLKLKKKSDHLFDKALQISKNSSDPKTIASIYATRLYIEARFGNEKNVERFYNELMTGYFEWVSTAYHISTFAAVFGSFLMRGKSSALLFCRDIFKRFLHSRGPSITEDYGYAVHMLQGYPNILNSNFHEAKTDLSICSNFFSKASQEEFSTHFLYYSLFLAITQMELQTANKEIDDFYNTTEKYCTFTNTPNQSFIWRSAVRSKLLIFHLKNDQKNNSILTQLKRNQKILKKYLFTPMMKAYFYLIEAEILIHENREKRVTALLEKAEFYSLESDSPILLFETYLTRAQLSKIRNDNTTYFLYLSKCLNIATTEGWKKKIEFLNTLIYDSKSNLPSEIKKEITHDLSISHSLSNPQLAMLKRQVDSILKLSASVMSIFDSKEQCLITLKETIDLLGAERGLLFLKDTSGKLQIQLSLDKDGKSFNPDNSFSEGTVKKVILERKTLILNPDTKSSSDISESIVLHNIRSILCSPIIFKDELIGVIYLDSLIARGIFDESDIQTLSAMCSFIAIAFESSRVASLEIERKILEKDIEITETVKTLLYPEKTSFATDEYSGSAHFGVINKSFGNWYWIDNSNPKKIEIFLNQIKGSNPGNSMIIALLAGAYHRLNSKLNTLSIDTHQKLDLLFSTIKNTDIQAYSVSSSFVELLMDKSELKIWDIGLPSIHKNQNEITITQGSVNKFDSNTSPHENQRTYGIQSKDQFYFFMNQYEPEQIRKFINLINNSQKTGTQKYDTFSYFKVEKF